MEGEIAWKWPEIAVVLFWRLAPRGVEMRIEDLVALPMDRVGMVKRRPEYLQLKFIPILQAQKMVDHPDEAGEKAEVEEMHGRWQKAAFVALWKLRKSGIKLTREDRAAVPADKQLLQSGSKDTIEFRFVSRTEAQAIAKWEAENEGRIIVERGHL